jgi:hypothetical protein
MESARTPATISPPISHTGPLLWLSSRAFTSVASRTVLAR